MMDEQNNEEPSPAIEPTILNTSDQAPDAANPPVEPPSNQTPSPVPRTHHKLALTAIVIIILVIVGGGAWFLVERHHKTTTVVNSSPIRIGLSMATLDVQRWPDEQAIMEKQAAKLGDSIQAYNANSDNPTQISQIENLIAQKVNVIIIVANDAQAVAPATEDAQKAGIPVIAYDRLIEGNGTTEYISFSSYKVGQIWANYVLSVLPSSLKTDNIAFLDGPLSDNNSTQLRNGVMSILTPLIQSGKVNLVFNQNIDNWDPGIAYTTFKADLATGTRVDAVIGGYDGLAYGAIEALQEVGLAGKVPVVGQDAELAAIQRMEAGTQMMTVYKPGYELADLAIKDAVELAKNQKIQSNTTVNNGTVNVPSYLFDPIAVTKNDINSIIIKGGVYTLQQINGSTSTTN
jgi:D-xylose transport system substrate-binding protein